MGKKKRAARNLKRQRKLERLAARRIQKAEAAMLRLLTHSIYGA